MFGSTESHYLSYAKKHNFKPSTIALKDGTKAFWIGEPSADHTVLYVHGGGWNTPGGYGHFALTDSFLAEARQRSKSVAFLLLQYDLVPHETYPYQLRQTVEFLRYALTELGKRPEQLMMMGDSAGGNMILSTLAHISHPNKDIAKLDVDGSMRGAVVMSPWVDFRNAGPTYQQNQMHDPVDVPTLRWWAKMYLNGKDDDFYNQPGRAPQEWWANLKVNDILILAGGNEMMVEDIRSLGEKIKVSLSRSSCED